MRLGGREPGWRGLCALCLGVPLYCEFLHYYLVLSLCRWPDQHDFTAPKAPLKLLLLADTHLLGIRRGHWFDKLRREWQMHRAFVTAQTLFSPQVIFLLGLPHFCLVTGGGVNGGAGDLFDEGQWSGRDEFEQYERRLRELFPLPSADTRMFAVAGNHDVGFHYAIWPSVLERFEKAFASPPVRLLSIHRNHFVLINSMAMEKDGCHLCAQAQHQLRAVNHTLECLKNREFSYRCDFLVTDVEEGTENLGGSENLVYSQPILLQHFPLYRESDAGCAEPDEGSAAEKAARMKPKWDVLSRDATQQLIQDLSPRAAFDGHSHNGCETWHEGRPGFFEWTLSSFSWRNRNNPAFLLAIVTPSEIQVAKCMMPRESTVIAIYVLAALFLFISLLCKCLRIRTLFRPKIKQ